MKRYIFITILFYLVFLTFISYRVSKAYFTDMAIASGNTFTAASEFPITPTLTPLTVVLNEIMAQPSTGAEWVEVYNASSDAIDLTGWKIKDLTVSNIEPLDTLGIISPGTFKTLEVTGGPILNNEGDTVFLLNSSDQTIDTHMYTNGDSSLDQSVGKDTDGTGSWKPCITPTKNTSNNGIC